MSLRHSLLAILTTRSMTGYELVKFFDGTVAYLWSAPHSQIYPTLRAMEKDGLVVAVEEMRGAKATKRRYSITERGVEDLRAWTLDIHQPQAERDTMRLKAAYLQWGSYEAARQQLTLHLDFWRDMARKWRAIVEGIDEGTIPLLAERLEGAPQGEHSVIVAFKRFAFRGTIYRAEAEVRWAIEGLELIDELERTKAPLVSFRAPPSPKGSSD